MFGKVIGEAKTLKVSEVEIGILFKIVDSAIKEHKGLICVRAYNSIVCLVGNNIFTSFNTTWDINPLPKWSIKILDEEQVILSNKEIG